MNIQIFGGGKNFDVKKAERYFKERRIPVQRVDLFEKGLSKGELRAVCRALGSAEALVDTGAKANCHLVSAHSRRGQGSLFAGTPGNFKTAHRAKRRAGDGRLSARGLEELGVRQCPI